MRITWLPTKKLLSLLVLAFAGIAVARADSPVPLATIGAIRLLSLAQANQKRPVAIEGTVTFYQPAKHLLFVQAGKAGIFVRTPNSTSNMVPGDRVLVRGITAAGHNAVILGQQITRVGHGDLLKPASANFNQLIQGQFDSTLVSVHGVMQTADMDAPAAGQAPGATLKIFADDGLIEVHLLSADPRTIESMLDARVNAVGVARGKFDGKMQMTGIVLYVSSLANIATLHPAAVNPWSLPLTPMDQILSASRANNPTQRVRISGTVTYFEPGSMLVLQNGAGSLHVRTASFAPMHIGNRAEAIGFPAIKNDILTLDAGEIRDTGMAAPITPTPITWDELASGQHLFDLVSIDGNVLMQASKSTQDEYVLTSGGHVFSAVSLHGKAGNTKSAMAVIPTGALVRVTGICMADNINPPDREAALNILIRSPADLQILRRPSPFTAHNFRIFALFLLLAGLGLGARAWFIDRKVRSQLAELGYLTQRRGEVLEAINRRRPLPEIIELVTELASYTLRGAPCWYQRADGDLLGNCPADVSGMRVAEYRVAARFGGALGTIFAAFDARMTPQSDEDKALASAAELATLAIETARLHADLVRRSEFDMLTDIQNRFSFEKHLDNLIEESRRNSNAFGVIFIDLNDFKLVNDRYGHQFGDAYLQHVADRMKNQLRPSDLLARLGGDEFGIVVASVQHRADIEEIVVRLKDCFDEPFSIGHCMLKGSASIGFALYPIDAATKDDLLSTADAAMYVEKRVHHHSGVEFLATTVRRTPPANPPRRRFFHSAS